MGNSRLEVAGRKRPSMDPAQTGREAVCTPLAGRLVSRLRACGIRQRFRSGQVIFYKGHVPLGIYIHESGRVRLKYRRGVECCCEGPCIMGLRSRLAGLPLPMTATAQEDVRITFLSRSAWNLFIQEHPSLPLEAIPIGPNPSRGVPFP